MPATPILYKNYKPAFHFNKTHKNTLIWSEQGRLLALAGFGNLAG